jgi:hypothetical protein
MQAMNAISQRDLRSASTATPSQPTSSGSAARTELLEALAKDATKPRYSTVVLAGLVRAAEFLIVVLTATIVHSVYVAPSIGYEPTYFVIAATVAGLSLLIFQMLHTYHPTAFRQPMRQIVRISGGWSLVFLIVLAAIFLLKLDGVN